MEHLYIGIPLVLVQNLLKRFTLLLISKETRICLLNSGILFREVVNTKITRFSRLGLWINHNLEKSQIIIISVYEDKLSLFYMAIRNNRDIVNYIHEIIN